MKELMVHDIKNQFNIAIVISRFNEEVTSALHDGAYRRLKELEFADDQITVVWVPGAIEIPIAAQRLARTEIYEAIVCLGAVIRGETTHYDSVCQQVSYGCQEVALRNDIPVIFGVLTTENEEQALARAGGSKGHKGRYAIDAAFEMVSVLRQIENQK
jgi:6,7-dimethyl-8-ribityllumazine synthase